MSERQATPPDLPAPVPEGPGDVTRLLGEAAAGRELPEELLPLVYEELRRLARQKMAGERPGQTLQATALVHEAYVRLAGAGARWANRAHFFAAAAEAMRRILVDRARRKHAARHGGGMQREDSDDALASLVAPAGADPAELIALDEALRRFAAEDPAKAELVKLRYFAGLDLNEAADALGMSRATAHRHWAYARAWLRDAMGAADAGGSVGSAGSGDGGSEGP